MDDRQELVPSYSMNLEECGFGLLVVPIVVSKPRHSSVGNDVSLL